MTSADHTACPGCGLVLPCDERAAYDGYFNASPECWITFSNVIGREFGDAILFGAVHQMTVDTYAVQHAGGRHPEKSVDVHLCGLHLALDRGVSPPRIAPLLQRLVKSVRQWPQFQPPHDMGSMTIVDIARAGSIEKHIEMVRAWADRVWRAWSQHHESIAAFTARHLG